MQEPSASYYVASANAVPGPSYQPQPVSTVPLVTPASSNGSQNGDSTRSSTRPAKKKAAKACLQCQRAHLTCDDSRPCQRCVKKGIGNECAEGHRKKAKYLMDDSEKATLSGCSSTRRPVNIKRSGGGKPVSSTSSPRIGDTGKPLLPKPTTATVGGEPESQRQDQQGDAPDGVVNGGISYFAEETADGGAQMEGVQESGQALDRGMWQETDTMYDNLPFDPAYPFGSEAANLEYAMLSSIFADSGTVTTPTLQSNSTDPPLFTLDNDWPESAPLGQPQHPPPSLQHSNSSTGPPLPADQATRQQQQQMQVVHPFGMNTVVSTTTRNGSTAERDAEGMAGLTFTGSAGGVVVESPATTMTPLDVYSLVVKPHDYTEGYHDLMKHLAKNFNQAAILRVVRALASFRPSLIALQMPLTTEDEVFLEKSFQRTLIELEKLISYNGTPTAVWRRTGEICLAGDEFCKLVDKSRTELVGRTRYIYQLFDNHSTVDYFEKFSQYAFENTTQNFFMQVTLVVVEIDPQRTPSETTRKIPCAGSFTIRRDVFDLPSVIIGQLLPTNA